MRDREMYDEDRMSAQTLELFRWKIFSHRRPEDARNIINQTVATHATDKGDPFQAARMASHLRNGVTCPLEYAR